MKFIRKKNMQEMEELLYSPQLHWMYTIRHMVISLPFFIALLIIWIIAGKYTGFFGLGTLIIQSAVKHLFLAALIAVLVVFIWRIFLYLNTEYGVTNKRLIIKKGIIRMVVAEIPVDRIESIYCLQGLMGRIFNYGTICISGIGGMMPVFYMVIKPYTLRRKITGVIEKSKTITVVHGDLPKQKPVVKEKPAEKKKEQEPAFRYGTFVRILPENNP